jgi:cyclopropane fatty-acyl-phospholipid synthase-like methyltransferase
VEIGCGIGRLAVPMARRFDEVVAVDIAPTMLDKLAEHARAAGVDNVHGFLDGQPWYARGPADLVYSLVAFQHIENWLEIVRYVARIAACLAPG